MALTKSDILDLLLPGLKAEFAIAYKTELDASTTEKIATVINTTMPVQKTPWLGAVPPEPPSPNPFPLSLASSLQGEGEPTSATTPCPTTSG